MDIRGMLKRVSVASILLLNMVCFVEVFAHSNRLDNSMAPAYQKHSIPWQATLQDTLNLKALPPEKRLDFLEGTWDILVDEKAVGVATFTKIIEGTAFEQEEVYFRNGTISKALISYAYREQKKWIQSWVDVWGYHLVLKGGLESNAIVLYMTTTYYEDKAGAQVYARQIFTNVTESGFRYVWEISEDEGKTWTINNESFYKRRKARGK